MRKLLNFYEVLQARVDSKKTALQLVEQVDEITRELYRSLDDPETLSRDLFKLSILSNGLGNYLVEAKDMLRQSETQYKFEVDKRKLELVKAGESATVAESKARIEFKPSLDEANDLEKNVNVLAYKRKSIESVIDTGRSRLSLIKGDMRNEQ